MVANLGTKSSWMADSVVGAAYLCGRIYFLHSQMRFK